MINCFSPKSWLLKGWKQCMCALIQLLEFLSHSAWFHSIGMVYVRILLRPTTTLWNSCRGWIKEHVNPLSSLQLRQCCYPGEIMWNKSVSYVHIISIPASDTEQTQNKVWCGIDSSKDKSEWSLSSIATCLLLQDALKKDITYLYIGNISKRNAQWKLSCGNYSSSDKKLY